MTTITKLSTAGVDGLSAQKCDTISQLFAGEALKKADACFIASDGLVYMSNYTAHQYSSITASGVSNFDGFTNKAVAVGEPVTLFGNGAQFGYGSSLTPGILCYVTTSDGLIADAKGGIDLPVAKVISATDIRVIR